MRNEMLGDDLKFLTSAKRPNKGHSHSSLRSVDLFCGCGGMSLGMQIAAADLGIDLQVALGIDNDRAAAECFKANFPEADTLTEDLASVFSGALGSAPTLREKSLTKSLGKIDLLIGGPPCQGHSDLNNFTRRKDPKNKLMLVMVRAAEILRPHAVIIENVVGSLNDSDGVVGKANNELLGLGYDVDVGILDLASIGVPQRRRRMIVVATKGPRVAVADIQSASAGPKRDVRWAIGDLATVIPSTLLDRPSTPQPQTRKRIDYLHDNNLYELPDDMRPPCHRDKDHSYATVYGRLRWNAPAQTITSGFYCMCMGRYVHPSKRRTLTAHEAARLQFFPDFFDFSPAGSRTKLAEIIGNAVPPKGAYAIGRCLLPTLLTKR